MEWDYDRSEEFMGYWFRNDTGNDDLFWNERDLTHCGLID